MRLWISERLHRLCVYDCESLKWARSFDQLQYLTVNDGNNSAPTYGVASYEPLYLHLEDLPSWAQRIPAGTRFVVIVYRGGERLTPARIRVRYPELSSLFHKHKWEAVNVSAFDDHGRCLDQRERGGSRRASLGPTLSPSPLCASSPRLFPSPLHPHLPHDNLITVTRINRNQNRSAPGSC
jgi:hypothetical protein